MPVKVTKNNQPLMYKQWTFPGGEIGIQLLDTDIKPSDNILVKMYGVPTFNDLMVVAQIGDAIKSFKEVTHRTRLWIPYLPYARQDRACNLGEAFALKVFMQMIDPIVLSYYSVCEISDLHSNVMQTFSLEGFYQTHPQWVLAGATVNYDQYDYLIAPDKGAKEKAEAYGHENLVTLNKVRKDGRVIYEDFTKQQLSGKVLVVDDICDGGGTFISLIEMLKKNQPGIKQIDLYVTHGIFSKGVDVLLDAGYTNIFTYNDMTGRNKTSYSKE